MKRIILSLGAITFVAALAVASTGAFFSDSETSTGNTFTAGAIDLKVDSTAHYAGLICTDEGVAATPRFQWQRENPAVPSTREDLVGTQCHGTWALTDGAPTLDQFFNLSDIKPGDPGENTVSLHLDGNDAYACADITNIQNLENSITGPEAALSDTGPAGELGQNLDFLVWLDNGGVNGTTSPQAGNNVWDVGEPLITHGTAPSTAQHYTLAAPPSAPLPGGSTNFLGVAWCAGTWQNVNPATPGTQTCDGSTMGNIAQTDSYSADIGFRVAQSRNNPNFTCAVTPQ